VTAAVGLAALLTAVAHELRKPAASRTWHGTVWRFVPYDLRRPTLHRFYASVWAPDDPHFIRPRAFGVGWTVNFAKVVATIRAARKR
jgi:hypothetical protein